MGAGLNYAAWGVSWLGTWGNSWGPLHEVEEDVIVGGGGRPFNGHIPKTKDEEKPIVYPAKHPWIHFPVESKLHKVAELTPELADAVIEAVSVVVEKRTVQDKDLETAKAEKELRKYIKAQEQRWKKEYAQLIILEYERREQELEDAQIAIMLFDM